jgi:predicted nucleic acid-binding Zn ribbon protein
MKKAFVPPTIVFRGSGWAKKDRSAVSTKSRAASDDGDAGSKSGEAADAAPSGSKEASKPTTPAGKSASGESSTSAAD